MIQIWFWGGPSQIETWDPKPEAGYDYCGQLSSPISTNVDGLKICELMPELAKCADTYSVIRSVRHFQNAHETGSYLVQTGRMPGRYVYPCAGAVVSKFKGVDAGYKGTIDNTETKARATGETTKDNGVFDQTLDAGINLNWTIFDGFNITANYQRLKELERQGETNTRIAIEDLIAISLSKERLRIVEERYHIGNFSRLDYQQAKVDFNADSAQYMKQQELLHTSRIQLNELMANKDVDQPFIIQDSLINVTASLNFEELWNATLTINASLLRAEQNNTLARLDYKKVCSRDYPYVKMNGGYGYTLNKYDISANSRRSNLGLNFGVTVGFNLFDGNRRRERKNARIAVQNARLEREQLEQALRADLSNLWQAYQNNLQMLNLERQNLVAAKENHEIAMERYMLGNLSGIEMREAQKSLLDAEERILSAEYDTKLCEISLLQISGKVARYME